MLNVVLPESARHVVHFEKLVHCMDVLPVLCGDELVNEEKVLHICLMKTKSGVSLY